MEGLIFGILRYVKYEKSREDLLNAMSGWDAWNKIIVQSIPTEC